MCTNVPMDMSARRCVRRMRVIGKYVHGRVECEVCPICLEVFGYGKVVRLSCGHCYHEECVVRWMKLSLVCPVCRHMCIDDD